MRALRVFWGGCLQRELVLQGGLGGVCDSLRYTLITTYYTLTNPYYTKHAQHQPNFHSCSVDGGSLFRLGVWAS